MVKLTIRYLIVIFMYLSVINSGFSAMGVNTKKSQLATESFCQQGEKLGYKIMVSSNLSLSLLSHIINEANAFDAQIVIKGMNENTSLKETLLFWHSLFTQGKPIVNLVINPLVFEQNKVSSVPTIIAFINDKPIAKVTGVTSIEWFQSKIKLNAGDCQLEKLGEVLDLGIQGPSVSISEIDMIESIHSKIAKMDWASKKQKAIDNYWNNLPSYDFPTTKECRTKWVSASIRLNKPLLDSKGREIIKAGTIINPFDFLPLTQKLIVFNATNKDELNLIEEYLKTSPGFITLIASKLSKGFPKQELNLLQKRFNLPIYLLNELLTQRFGITHTPSLVTGEKASFAIKEGCLI